MFKSADRIHLRTAFSGFTSILLFGICSLQAAEYKVYLLGGQSNGDGRALNAELPAALREPQNDVLIYYDDLFDGTRGNPQWQALRPGLSGGYLNVPGNTSMFGPEISFGRTMADAAPNDHIAIIKYSPGGSNLYSQWKATDPIGPMYRDFLGHVENALESLENNGNTYTIAGMLWMQGENDTVAYDSAHNYEANLTNFINAVRTDVEGAANLRFVIGQINGKYDRSTFYEPYDEDSGIVVQQAQYNVSRNMPNAPLVVTDDLDLASDVVHFTASGQRSLGERFANRILVDAVDNDKTIGYWRFEKSLGFVSDSSGNCLTLARGNGDATISDEPILYSLPESGRGAGFDGPVPKTGDINVGAASLDGGDYFKHADDDRFSMHDFTVEVYFNRSSSGDSPVFASQYAASGNQRSWAFGVRSTSSGSQLYLYLSEDGVSYESCYSELAAPILDNDYYAAVSFGESEQNGGVTFYLKDLTTGGDMQVDVKNHTITSLHDSSANFTIGARSDLYCKFTGLIDEVRLTPSALEEKDLLASHPAQGDANRNGKVDENDAAIMAENWLSGPNATWAMGDFNGDGAVNDVDAAILAANWHYGVVAQAAVPEPFGIIRCLTLFLGFFIYHRAVR